MAIVLCLLGSSAFLIDLSVSRWMHTQQGLSGLHQPLQVVESFGDSTGVALLLMTIFLVSVERRRELARVVSTVVAAGLTADLIKFFIARLRPRSFKGDSLLHLQSVTETFHGWFPLIRSDGEFGSRYQSFPSAHTATAFALAVCLSKMYPRGRAWFTLLACGVALQRVETGAHYLSDVFFGAAVGIATGLCFHRHTGLAGWFDRYEAGGSDVRSIQ